MSEREKQHGHFAFWLAVVAATIRWGGSERVGGVGDGCGKR